MKRYILIVAAVALATVSCSRNYDVNTAGEQEIGFGTWAEQLTKARVQGSNDFTSGDTFAVFGVKTRASGDPTSQVVFNGDVVTASGSGTLTWSYDIPRFWDVTYDSYTFYAVSPSKVGENVTASLNTSTGAVAASTSITFAGNNNDILVSDKKVVAKGSSPYFSNYGDVLMQFNHICTLFDLKVKKHTNLNDATVAITKIELSNMDKTGTFAISDAYTGNHPQATWTSTDKTATYTQTSGVNPVTLPTNVKNDGSDYLIQDLIAMPQTIRGDENIQTVTISYTITPTGADEIKYENISFILKSFDNDGTDDNNTSASYISKWNPGTHYVYTIIIDANKIDFTAAISDWTEPINGYHYLLN